MTVNELITHLTELVVAGQGDTTITVFTVPPDMACAERTIDDAAAVDAMTGVSKPRVILYIPMD